jgi:hypothetical protein
MPFFAVAAIVAGVTWTVTLGGGALWLLGML